MRWEMKSRAHLRIARTHANETCALQQEADLQCSAASQAERCMLRMKSAMSWQQAA